MDVERLRCRLKEIEAVSQQQWLDSLNDRKKEELKFHDEHRDTSRIESLDKKTYEKLYGNKKYYQESALVNIYVDNWIRENAEGKIFLDYACGNGKYAIKAAKFGAKLSIGLDISRVSVENAKKEAHKQEADKNTYFIQADVENTMLPDSSIEIIICSGMLHHLDLSYAFFELRRILVPGGKILAVESLNYNPVFKLYRYTTSPMRTDWEKEHILSYKDIGFAKRFFQVKQIKHWHLFSVIGVHLPLMLVFLNKIDRFILKLPLIKMMSWMFTFELHKKE